MHIIGGKTLLELAVCTLLLNYASVWVASAMFLCVREHVHRSMQIRYLESRTICVHARAIRCACAITGQIKADWNWSPKNEVVVKGMPLYANAWKICFGPNKYERFWLIQWFVREEITLDWWKKKRKERKLQEYPARVYSVGWGKDLDVVHDEKELL